MVYAKLITIVISDSFLYSLNSIFQNQITWQPCNTHLILLSINNQIAQILSPESFFSSLIMFQDFDTKKFSPTCLDCQQLH